MSASWLPFRSAFPSPLPGTSKSTGKQSRILAKPGLLAPAFAFRRRSTTWGRYWRELCSQPTQHCHMLRLSLHLRNMSIGCLPNRFPSAIGGRRASFAFGPPLNLLKAGFPCDPSDAIAATRLDAFPQFCAGIACRLLSNHTIKGGKTIRGEARDPHHCWHDRIDHRGGFLACCAIHG